ncbi:MAG: protease modulator HflC [Alphaproteobacteria bacterium]|nr:protease modulator HflC [Alphaproteobacteria bacterium]
MEKKLIAIAFILLIAFIGITQAAFVVAEPEQAMVMQFGDPVAQYTKPGLKFKVPFIQSVARFDRRVLDVDPEPEQVILADQKRLVVDTFARYRIENMLTFYTTLRTEAQATSRLNTIISSNLRSTLGNVGLTDVLSEKRQGLMDQIQKQVNAAVNERFGIEIVDVRIGRADLPKQTSQAIYDRMRTEREREAAEFRAQGQELAQEIRSKADRTRTVLLAEAEKKAQILRGEGDKDAIKIYADAFNRDPAFFAFYRTMEAYKTSLADSNTTLVLNPEGDFLRYLTDARIKK